MKIKTFKKQLRSENYIIPDVLDSLKSVAYTKEYPLVTQKNSFFKTIIQLVPVTTVFIICLLVLFNLEENSSFNTPHEGERIVEEKQPEGLIDPNQIPKTLSQDDFYDYYINNSNKSFNFDTFMDDYASSSSTPELNLPDVEAECSNENYCMYIIKEGNNTISVLDEDTFLYLLNYMKKNNSNIIDSVNNVKEKFSIPDSDTKAISDAYNYIKNNNIIK